jgi:aspartyl-tRNA(Asn)/glutamyl-tRNA(Gln) amidotransferase subunit B
MNSIRNVRVALTYEIQRHAMVLNDGGRIVQSTLLWDVAQGVTQLMRSKEEAHDYRYFPDPDLVPLDFKEEDLEALRKTLPELPENRRARFEKDLGLSPYDAGVLTAEKPLADYYEEGLAPFSSVTRPAAAKPLANWLTTELLGRLNALKKDITQSPIPPSSLAALVDLLLKNTINGKAAKVVFAHLFTHGGDPQTIVNEKGLLQVEDEGQIRLWVEEVVVTNPSIVADIRGGKGGALGSLVGQVMKKSSGRANPQTVNRLLKQIL